MTTPSHDGDDLNQLIREMEVAVARMQATLAQLKAQRDADARTEIEARRRRASFYLIPGGLTGIAAIIGLGRRLITHPAGSAAVASALTAAAVSGAFLIARPGAPHRPYAAPPPATALPPLGHTPPRTGPPKSGPPVLADSPPPGAPNPQPSGERPGSPPVASGSPGASARPTTTVTTTVEAPGSGRPCRILLPSLPIVRGLLCGQI